jgi:hypothetical protein
MTTAQDMLLSWSAAYIIPTHHLICFLQDLLLRNYLIPMGTLMKRPELSLIIQLTFSLGHLVNFEKCFSHQFLAFLSFYSTRGFKSIHHFLHKDFIFCEFSLFIKCQCQRVSLDNDKVHVANDLSNNDINTLFMLHESVTFKDGQGITRQVNYLGPHIIKKVLKHKICTEDDTYLFADAILLSSINAPDIGTIPDTVEQYVTKLP